MRHDTIALRLENRVDSPGRSGGVTARNRSSARGPSIQVGDQENCGNGPEDDETDTKSNLGILLVMFMMCIRHGYLLLDELYQQ